MKTAISLREQKKRQTRDLLRSSALKLFSERGYAQTSVDDVAAAAGVSRTTFFRYFPSKEDVVFADPEEMALTFHRLLLERPRTENPLESFEQALIALSTAVEHDPEVVKGALALWDLLQKNPDLRARQAENRDAQALRVAQVLAERDGLEDALPDHHLAAAIGFEIAQAVNVEWVASRGQVSASGLLRKYFLTLRQLTA